MSDSPDARTRHHEYSYRLPTPPRIVVPPPTLTTEPPELHLPNQRAHDEEIDTSFLKNINLDSVVQTNTLLEWHYAKRRQAQMILPWLYLGPLSAAKDKEFLAREGITMVFAIRANTNSMRGLLQAALEVCHEVAAVEASNCFSLTGKFADATRIINTHVAKFWKYTQATGNPQLGKVLVFCESGNDKSAAVAAAYLMELLDDFDHIKSMQVCQAQRFCVNFDDALKLSLQSYWDILQARRSVSNARADKPKRSIEELRDDDVDMGSDFDDDPSIRPRRGNLESLAPFAQRYRP
ncbi:phosphatases II [Byssothecium circinans]|uniref:Phosphatases II n=1 Tax=Byssothecium circinans TaxID=147558 RepID=A0A6A5TR70_9PLEO|nr:phosphatases II [Byssothecium circinans]